MAARSSHFINTSRYTWLSALTFESLSSPTSPAIKPLASLRDSFLKTGVATLPHFLTPSALSSAVSSCQVPGTTLTRPCFVQDGLTHNAYLLPHEPLLPPDHPRNRQLSTKVASIAADELPVGGVIPTLYEDERLVVLISAVVFGVEAAASDYSPASSSSSSSSSPSRVYPSVDPLGRCSINVFKKGWKHSYHFDESEFSTTLNLQQPPPGFGGVFEMTPRIRSSSSEMVYDIVSDVLDHESNPERVSRTSVSRLAFQPGTLSVFAGRYSLHRVTDVSSSDRDRLVAVLTYGRKPGFRNSEEVQKMFWGRSTPMTSSSSSPHPTSY